ncbi:MAG: hypothetical protein ABI867_23805 [Kofleriaceae bacterium]
MTPGKARIEIGIRKTQHFLGENTLIDFCVVNTGTTAFELDAGGDYRGSSRSLRFKVEVRDAKGKLLADPDPNPFNLGGMSYTPKLEPGKRWCESLPLGRYARLEAPGTYTITATHDLGWPAGSAPTGKATIKLAMPSPAEAEKVIAAIEALPDDPNRVAGDVSKDYADWSTLAYPVYVAPLEARAHKGNDKAITGLAYAAVPEATRALVALLDHADAKVAKAAAGALALRLPDPQLAGQLGARNPFEDARAAQRTYLAKAWIPALADDVRAAAHKRLASTDIADQRVGAFMLEAVGTLADVADLIKALEVAIDRTRTVPAETNVYPVPRGAMMELMRAAEILVGRGAIAGAPKTAGQTALWLAALHKGARPAGWETELGKAFVHPTAYVRQLAMERAPDTLTPALASALAANLAHADVDVQVAAAQLAERAKLHALAPTLVKAMSRATGLRLNVISNAAYQLGARYDRVQMLVVRLADAAAFDEALSDLCDLLVYSGRSVDGKITPAQRAAVIPHWKALIAAHKTEIETDKKLALADVTKDLLPPTWKLGKPTGGQWP